AFITTASTGCDREAAALRTERTSATSIITSSKTLRPVSASNSSRAASPRSRLRQPRYTREISSRAPTWRASSLPMPALAPVMRTEVISCSPKLLPPIWSIRPLVSCRQAARSAQDEGLEHFLTPSAEGGRRGLGCARLGGVEAAVVGDPHVEGGLGHGLGHSALEQPGLVGLEGDLLEAHRLAERHVVVRHRPSIPSLSSFVQSGRCRVRLSNFPQLRISH